MKGANGQVFTAYMDMPLPTDPAFTGAATMDTSLLISLSDTIEHACWIAMEDNLHETVDWTKQTHLVNMTALNASNITHLSQTIATLVSCIVHSSLLDTGASVHVTTNSNDFKILHPFNPCSVNSLEESLVSAIGIGNVHLHTGKGVHIVLHDVLYIPDASVLLISILVHH
jgi:hexokinase